MRHTIEKDKAIEKLENSFEVFKTLIASEKKDLKYRFDNKMLYDNHKEFEEMGKLCFRIARHMEQKEDFKFSIEVLKDNNKKYRGISL